MTMTMMALPDHTDPVRHAYWLSRDDRSGLAEAIVTLQASAALFPATKRALDAILVELGVAEARDSMWPERAGLVRAVQGHPTDHLPIRMSDAERDAIMGISLLPDPVRNRLAPSTEMT